MGFCEGVVICVLNHVEGGVCGEQLYNSRAGHETGENDEDGFVFGCSGEDAGNTEKDVDCTNTDDEVGEDGKPGGDEGEFGHMVGVDHQQPHEDTGVVVRKTNI